MKLNLPKAPWQHQAATSLASELFIHEPAQAKGTLTTHEDVLIDTHLQGDIVSNGHVTVGPNAVIVGSVSARSIRHQGSLEGSASATSLLVLQGGSKLLHSKVASESIEVQPGSQLIDVNITTN